MTILWGGLNTSVVERAYEHELASFFRQNGWKVKVHPSFGGRKADLYLAQGDRRYIVELKSASEGWRKPRPIRRPP
jgi:hypothetical protein